MGLYGDTFVPFMLRIGNQGNMSQLSQDNKYNIHYLVKTIINKIWIRNTKAPKQKIEEVLSQFRQDIQMHETQSKKKDNYDNFDELCKILTELKRARCYYLAAHAASECKYKNQALRKVQQCFVDNAEVIFTTVNGLGSIFHTHKYDAVVIDESCQLKECESLIALQNTKRIINIGDPNQLQPTILYHGLHRSPLLISLFERVNPFVTSHLLNIQYRMHPEISSFPNSHFYDNKLNNADKTKIYKKSYYEILPPYQFINVTGVEQRTGNSLYNLKEIRLIVEFIKVLQKYTKDIETIGIITPYLEQKRRIEQEIITLRNYFSLIVVDTVDGFQGSECDIVFLSCVRTQKENIGFID
eukprot:UN25755